MVCKSGFASFAGSWKPKVLQYAKFAKASKIGKSQENNLASKVDLKILHKAQRFSQNLARTTNHICNRQLYLMAIARMMFACKQLALAGLGILHI